MPFEHRGGVQSKVVEASRARDERIRDAGPNVLGNVGSALAAVLEPFVLVHHQTTLDDIDLRTVLALARHFFEGATALRTDAVRLIEFVDPVDDAQLRLRLTRRCWDR